MPDSLKEVLARLKPGSADSSALIVRLGYVNWSGIGRPLLSVSREFLVGLMANGWIGMFRLDNIC